MKGTILILGLIIFSPPAGGEQIQFQVGDLPQPTKATLIEELIQIENANKSLHLDMIELEDFLAVIRGEDGSHCMENRYIAEGQLGIKLTVTPSPVSISVDLGVSSETIKFTSDIEQATKFAGTLSSLSPERKGRGYMSRLTLRGNNVTISSIKLKLDSGNGITKTFFDDTKIRILGSSISFTMEQIRENNAFQAARRGSCQD